MQSFTYDIPKALQEEKEALEWYIGEMIKSFNTKAETLRKQEREREQLKLQKRIFVYSIVNIENDWKILHKAVTPETATGAKDDVQWSIPFKIINGVLFHSPHAYKQRFWNTANAVIPQGLFTEEQLVNLIQNW